MKKTISIILILTLSFALTGCSISEVNERLKAHYFDDTEVSDQIEVKTEVSVSEEIEEVIDVPVVEEEPALEDKTPAIKCCSTYYYDENDNITDWYVTEYNQNGDITYNAEIGSDGITKWYNVYDFNDEGREIGGYFYGEDRELSSAYTIEYDSASNRVVTYNFGERWKYIGVKDQQYNDDGKLVSDAWYDVDGNWESGYDYTYDSKGNLIRYIYSDSEYGTVERYEYSFDNDDNMIRLEKYNSDGVMEYWSEYVYDVNGYMLAYYADGIYDGDYWYEEYSYDNNGNQLTEVHMDDGGNIVWREERTYSANDTLRTVNAYDGNGMLLSDGICNDKGNYISMNTYAEDGSVSFWSRYEYNEDGTMWAYEYRYMDSGVDGIFRYEYFYDDNKNCTLTNLYKNGLLISYTVKVYDYYQ